MTTLPLGLDSKTTAAGVSIAITDTDPPALADGNEAQALDAFGKHTPPHDLKGRTMRGALVSTAGQGANFVLRVGSMVVLARLLTAEDFGVVGMVIAFTGFLDIFRDFGLSMAAGQHASISQAQHSTLFWINLAIGLLLAA